MSNRSEKIEFYVTPEEKRRVEQLAADDDTTVSSYCHALLDRHLQADVFGKKAREHDVERRLEELVAEARDEVQAVTTGVEQLQELTARHSIAVWELLKPEYGGTRRNEAMTTASTRLRENQGKLTLDPDQFTADTAASTDRSSTESVTPGDDTATADSDTAEDDDDRSWDFT